jgi:tRNA(fMet)-specific endonuclease VapC
MFLFDTNILSNMVSVAPSAALVRKIAFVPRAQQYTSSITLGEMLCGAYRLGAGAQALVERFNRALWPNLTVLPFDEEAAPHYARVRAELERRGRPIGDADLRIAAIALARDLTVVTANVREFQRVPGLRVENWLTQP